MFKIYVYMSYNILIQRPYKAWIITFLYSKLITKIKESPLILVPIQLSLQAADFLLASYPQLSSQRSSEAFPETRVCPAEPKVRVCQGESEVSVCPVKSEVRDLLGWTWSKDLPGWTYTEDQPGWIWSGSLLGWIWSGGLHGWTYVRWGSARLNKPEVGVCPAEPEVGICPT